ncbi:NfeD family protein [Candidatus Marinarcus aquaticus]|nr:nodulation protein NfeD [Candidatus Marinarcus aquaticus]
MRLIFFFFIFIVNTSIFASNITHFSYEGAINPASNTFVKKAISHANEQNSQLIIFELNTPGGLFSSTRDMISQILNSSIPFVVYVSPKGARAASAGTYILYASHIAAMTQGSNVGAATPVQMGMIQDKNKNNNPLSTMKTKAINDATAYIESLAKLHGRNIQWAQKSVTEGASIDAQKALELGVINFVANDVQKLIQQLDQFEVEVNDKTLKLDTNNATLLTVEEGFKIKLLSYLSNPNIAYILMLIAMYGIFFEMMNPGSILPGVTGVISGALALYALNILPFDYAGLLLILIGVGLMAAEVFVVGFGVLGMGGVIAFVFGSLILFDEKTLGVDISLSLIAAFAVVSVVIFIYLLKIIIQERDQKAKTGTEQMLGTVATVVKKNNNGYKVAIHSEVWNALSQEEVQVGQEVIVEAIKGLTLQIKPKKKE